ncbi:MAG: pirin family protein [Polyangiales bacterium]
MITLRRAKERQHQRRRKQEAWLTFHPQQEADTLTDGFGALGIFREGRLPPRTGTEEPREDAEIITYVREGTLAYEDSMGQSGLIRAGEFQRMTAGRAIRYSETNASPTEWAHVFQISLRPSVAGLEPGHEQKRFSLADRHGILRVVASPDAREGSLRIHQDASLYSAVLDRGQHVTHALSEGRGAWLHIVQGEVTLGEIVLGTGDGVGVVAERVVSMTAREETEILLVDLGLEPAEQLADARID